MPPLSPRRLFTPERTTGNTVLVGCFVGATLPATREGHMLLFFALLLFRCHIRCRYAAFDAVISILRYYAMQPRRRRLMPPTG